MDRETHCGWFDLGLGCQHTETTYSRRFSYAQIVKRQSSKPKMEREGAQALWEGDA